MKTENLKDDIPSYQGILKMFFDIEKNSNQFGKKYKFFKTKNKKILKGTLEKYNLDEEYSLRILKTIGKMSLDYFNPTISTNFIKIICCLNGECSFFSKEYEKSFLLKKGDIIIYKMNNRIKKYTFESDDLQTVTINLNLDKLKNNFSKSTNNSMVEIWNNRFSFLEEEKVFYYLEMNQSIEALAKYIQKTSLKNIDEYLAFKMRVFCLMLEIFALQKREAGIKRQDSNFEIINKVKNILEKSRAVDFPSVKKICEILNLTNHQIQSSFKKIEGMSLGQYIQKTKMKYAKMLLKENNYSIIEIAYEIGYDNPSKFSKTFKKHFGMSPSTYKKEFFEKKLHQKTKE